GRYGEKFGATGYWYDDAFDGVRLQYKATDEVTASVGYGYAKGMNLNTFKQFEEYQKLAAEYKDLENPEKTLEGFKADLQAAQAEQAKQQKRYDEAIKAKVYPAALEAGVLLDAAKDAVAENQEKVNGLTRYQALKAMNLGDVKDLKSPEMTYATLGYNGHNVRVLGTYIAPNGDKVDAAGLDEIWGAGAIFGLNEDFSLSGDYFNVDWKDRDDAEFWTARVDFGHLNMKKPGSFNIFVDYVDAEPGSYLGGTGALRTSSYLNNTESWAAGFGVVVAENVKLEGLRTFSAETKDGADLDDLTKVQLSYKF
ncbi:MAG: hypothetical protein E7E73_01585, partial [Negativicoccus succinicivorans]|nr:hypothetical protein [Negativicoccus succinicivorans]